jgi:23S rRNA (guanosine2251-2'-O)-methyltransferase
LSPPRPDRHSRRQPARRASPPGPAGLGGTQVEGRQAVRELLRAGRRPVRQLYVADGSGPSEALDEIVELAARAGVAVRRVDRDRIDAMAGTDSPQGVVAVAGEVTDHTLDDLISGRPGAPAPFLVVLDGVTDPHNLGAVMRSALCAGATGLVLGRHRSAHLSPAAVKAAAGAVEHLPVATVGGIPAALGSLSSAGVWTVGLDAEGSGGLWDLAVSTEPIALVLGAEGRGLSPLARRRCEVTVSIPLSGPLESLNVSAAAALACFEVARGRLRRPGN